MLRESKDLSDKLVSHSSCQQHIKWEQTTNTHTHINNSWLKIMPDSFQFTHTHTHFTINKWRNLLHFKAGDEAESGEGVCRLGTDWADWSTTPFSSIRICICRIVVSHTTLHYTFNNWARTRARQKQHPMPTRQRTWLRLRRKMSKQQQQRQQQYLREFNGGSTRQRGIGRGGCLPTPMSQKQNSAK